VVQTLLEILRRSTREKAVLVIALVASFAAHIGVVGLARGRKPSTPLSPRTFEVEVIEIPSEAVEPPPPAPTLPPPVEPPRPKPHARVPRPVAAPEPTPPAPAPPAPEVAPAPAAEPPAGPAIAVTEAASAPCVSAACLPVGQGGSGKVGTTGTPGPGSLGVPRVPSPPAGDAPAVRLVHVKPAYPARAVDEEIEGWVLVRFTIAADGSVLAPEVMDASPKRIFDKSALDAVRRWKYRPTMLGGRAVARPGVFVKVSFELE
jgi:protein TonB